MAGRNIYHLTDDEVDLLIAGKDNPDIISNYFLALEGEHHGWCLDENFDPEGAWQRAMHFAKQKRILIIGGFGTGKTRGVGVSGVIWSITTRDFAFLNAAPRAWQSELMYNFILSLAEGTPLEHMIFEKPKKPYPKIVFKFWAKNVLITSTMEFMSVDKNANAILSWEGDWANVDEAGQIDDLESTIINLGSRMRGTVRGRERLGRMSMTSNSWDNPELWYRYDLAVENPEEYLSITVSSRYNHNITEEQLKMMIKDIPEDERERFIDGSRPEGRGNYFNKHKVYACEDKNYGEIILDGTRRGIDGYAVQNTYGCGVTYFTIPYVGHHSYMLLGDPGVGAPPNRNAPCLMVFDVTDFPKKKANMVAFWWGNGNGSITPFTTQILKFMAMYNPIFTGVDSTGPQKNTNQLLNSYLLTEKARSEENKLIAFGIDLSHVFNQTIGGLDFSGGKKPAYLISCRLMIESGLILWPLFVTGMRSQLTNYDPAKDTQNEPKIPQDLVSTLCMATYAIRVWFHINPNEALAQLEATNTPVDPDAELANIRMAQSERSARSESRR